MQRAVGDDAVAVADDASVALEVEGRPLVLQIGLRERARAVQRRLDRRDDLGHGRGVGGCGGGALHVGGTLPACRYMLRA
jgi:hypothetical protein